MVRRTLCATALVGDLVIPHVGAAEALDELGEEGDGEGRVGYSGGGHGENRNRNRNGERQGTMRVCEL